jgi:hypothetical protein
MKANQKCGVGTDAIARPQCCGQMSTRRAKRAAAVITAAAIPVLMTAAQLLAMPQAHATDPLAGIRDAVTAVRNKAGCPPLMYKVALETAAGQAAAPNTAVQVGYNGAGPDHVDGYPGKPSWYSGDGDPAAEAINGQYGVMAEGASGAISDCSFTDYGAGFARDTFGTDTLMDRIVIVLGQPAAPVATPPLGTTNGVPLNTPNVPVVLPPPVVSQPPVAPPLPTPTAVVTSDVDLYDVSGGNGNIIGMLRQGQVVNVVKACTADDWCDLTDPQGSAWGAFLQNN